VHAIIFLEDTGFVRADDDDRYEGSLIGGISGSYGHECN
jgi:hypothetical protein